MKNNVKKVESGDIYFLYRPEVGDQQPEGLEDIQRFYMVLEPESHAFFRMIIVGRKKLPSPEERERFWAFVDLVGKKKVREQVKEQHYQTKTRGERTLPEMRGAGEGRYMIVAHDNHAHLAYQLELPKRPHEVQSELDVERQASYIISVKNPEAPSPPGAGLRPKSKADFPKRLQEEFHGRRFIPVTNPQFLNHERAELMLVGASEEPSKELGLTIKTESERGSTAEIFNELQLSKSNKTEQPLFRGEWD